MSIHTLAETPPETHANTILYRLAVALGYPIQVKGTVEAPERYTTADPDDVLREAVHIIEEHYR